MRYLSVIILLCLLVTTAFAQDISLAPGETVSVQFENIEFELPDIMATGLEMTIEPEYIPDSYASPWFIRPAALQFLLPGNTDGADSLSTPQIQFFRLDKDMSRFENDSKNFAEQLYALQTLLEERPSLEHYIGHESDLSVSLPFAPVSTSQIFRAKPEYIETDTLIGVRYITMHSQGVEPVTDSSIYYTFQGLSKDGQYYIAAIMELSSGQLPDPDANYDSSVLIENSAAMYTEWAMMLHNLDDEAYTPSITILDDIVRSIQIDDTDSE